jgi:hypothetical protein
LVRYIVDDRGLQAIPRGEAKAISRAEADEAHAPDDRNSVAGELNAEPPQPTWLRSYAMKTTGRPANPDDFNELREGNATFPEKEPAADVVGQVRQESFRDLGGREVLNFLLRAHVIRTEGRERSEFCMTQETETKESYRAELSGYHAFTAGRTYVAPLRFRFEIDADGTLRIAPTGQPPTTQP